MRYFRFLFVILKILLTLGLQNETSSRMLIDTFFRTAVMVPPDQRMIVMLETPVPTVRPKESKAETVSGVMDYTCLVADADLARTYSFLCRSTSRRVYSPDTQ
jgi:hypothetical protein